MWLTGVRTNIHLHRNGYVIQPLVCGRGSEKMSEVLMLIRAESPSSFHHPVGDKVTASFLANQTESDEMRIHNCRKNFLNPQEVHMFHPPTCRVLGSIILPVFTLSSVSKLSSFSHEPRLTYKITQTTPSFIVSAFSHLTRYPIMNQSSTQGKAEWASIKPLRHLCCVPLVILCYWPCCFQDKWNLINHHRKLQKPPCWGGSIFLP